MRKLKEPLLAYAMLSPALLILGAFGIFPVAYSLFVSLHKWRLRPGEFVGLDNYVQALGDLRAAGMILLGALLTILAAAVHGLASTRSDRGFKSLAWAVGLAGGIVFALGAGTVWREGDPKLMQGLKITAFHALYAIPIQMSLALSLAFILHQRLRMRGLFRILFFLPYVTPMVASAMLFKGMMTGREASLANRALGLVGIPAQKWFDEPNSVLSVLFEIFHLSPPGPWANAAFPSLALLSIILYTIWVYVGYDIVLFLAGLSNIPSELFDAARIDGAKAGGVVRHIVLPLLSPTLYFVSVVAVIGTFRAFNHIYVLRTPGAARTVDSASVVIFNTFFKGNNAGYASCMALILFLVILALTLIQRRFIGKRVFYG